jgi:hypothetical protein
MPGDDYYAWLNRLHEALRPETYVEIGIRDGAALACARPPTRAFGIDPSPSVASPLKTETHIFPETSDVFFGRRRLTRLLDGRPLSLAFIDGLHHFEQCLRDFINLEAYCGPSSVILVHDTVPLDERTQSREQRTKFWTGDVWKTVLALRHYRPDLDIFTIATAPTGLTVVTGLDSTSRQLAACYDAAVERFMDTVFADVDFDAILDLLPNDWGRVMARLATRGIVGAAP